MPCIMNDQNYLIKRTSMTKELTLKNLPLEKQVHTKNLMNKILQFST